MKIIAESILTSKDQLTVPKVVRQLLNLRSRDTVIWSLDAQGQLVVSGGRTNTLENIRAAVAAAERTGRKTRAPLGVTIEGMKAGIARAVKSKHGRHRRQRSRPRSRLLQ
jgi:bifunctional DNA-binding transcriptional regulator/antitoxin component of YhaV-PrlF toxin-antitoxin module